MQIFLKTPNRTITLDVEPTDTIREVKQKVHEKEGLPIDWLRIKSGLIKLEDNAMLREYNIIQASFLYLLEKRPLSLEKETIMAASELDVSTDEMQMKIMSLLLADPGNPTKSEIIHGLDLGRGGDTPLAGYDLIIGATKEGNFKKEEIEAARNNGAEIAILPIVSPEQDVGVKSFKHQEQKELIEILRKIDFALNNRQKVFVACQQGKDRSALVVLCYLVAKYGVDSQQAYNFVQKQRPIVSTKDIPLYWKFLTEEFKKEQVFSNANAAAASIASPKHEDEITKKTGCVANTLQQSPIEGASEGEPHNIETSIDNNGETLAPEFNPDIQQFIQKFVELHNQHRESNFFGRFFTRSAYAQNSDITLDKILKNARGACDGYSGVRTRSILKKMVSLQEVYVPKEVEQLLLSESFSSDISTNNISHPTVF